MRLDQSELDLVHRFPTHFFVPTHTTRWDFEGKNYVKIFKDPFQIILLQYFQEIGNLFSWEKTKTRLCDSTGNAMSKRITMFALHTIVIQNPTTESLENQTDYNLVSIGAKLL